MSTNEPLDLTTLFGECWGITVTAHPVDTALAAMSITHPEPIAEGPGLAAQYLDAQDEVLILAHQIAPGQTLILQLDPAGGWAGLDPNVLSALIHPRAITCTITYLPNSQTAWFAEPKYASSGIDPATGRRWGTPSPDLDATLEHIGYPTGSDEPSEELDQYSPAQRGTLILRAVTGLDLQRSHLANPWTGGIRPVSATLENEADPTLENKATGSSVSSPDRSRHLG